MIKEDYVSFEVAKLLKEKGFDEPSRFWYDNNGVISQKYIDALDRAKGMWEQGMMPERIEYIFPELKESEDERIRKEIIFFFEQEIPQCSIEEHKEYMRKWISWLEKQGEKESDPRYENLEEILAADDIYQMSMNDEMVQEAKEKAVNALSGMCIGRLLGLEKQGEQKETDYNEELEKCKANPLYFFDVGYKELNLNTAKCEYCGTVFEYNSSDLEEEEDRDMRGYHYYYYAKCPKCGNRIFVKSLI